jgi:hypothetical protein
VQSLIINGDGSVARSLTARLTAHGHDVDTLRLPDGQGEGVPVKEHFERAARSGRHYVNVYLDLTEGFNEVDEFGSDAELAALRLGCRLKELLKVLKYSANHLARADGGRIWVLCYDHSLHFSVGSPSNPVSNYAAMAAVQALAKEVAHFDVKVNLFLIHPPVECVEPAKWKAAKNKLDVYTLRYKPQSAEHISETLHMYAQIANLSTTGGIIPVGSGIAACNV